MDEQNRFRIPIYIATGIFIICIPFFLLTSNLRWAANDIRLYEYGYDKYDASENTGLSDEELTAIAEDMIIYLNTGEQGDTFDIFNEREIIHLNDVRNLIQLCYAIQWGALGYIAAFIAAGLAWRRRRFVPLLFTSIALGSVFTIAAMSILGVAALIDFNWLFTAFHRVFFSGDSWVLFGYLPWLYTEGFFFDVAKFVAIAIVVESVLLGGFAGFFTLRRRRAGG
ncbi:MAG: DUF1461 domain-containing protein [Chloroflexota bacterium]|nr:DUF1461 domain-containing protein [Chloroflexota bacterium]